MAFLLMVVLVGAMLGALLVPMIVTQNRTTRFDMTRVQALGAAQAGIDVALGLIRGSVKVDISLNSYGDTTKLPCGPLTGVVTTGPAAYKVTIEYFTFDPVSEPDVTTNNMLCTPGHGTYELTPSFARITSKGTVGTAINGSTSGRTLITTYVLRTTNTNIPGGVIQIYPAAKTSMCMDVGSATATAGTAVVLQTCSTSKPAAPQQVFAYRSDLTVQLLSSVTSTNPTGLCLSPASIPAATNDAVKLAQCAALGSPPYQQQWSYNDYGSYQAAQLSSQNDGVLPDLCMNVANQSANVALTLKSCHNVNSLDPAQGWIPSPSVGAGAAAATNSLQWINYYEFGRCLDVTSKSVGADHLIDYPCKQNPSSGAVAWNQKFTAYAIPSTKLVAIYTITDDSTVYCLTSPGTIGGNVTVKLCGTPGAQQTWTTNGGDASLPYSTKYTVVDSAGLCLGLTPTGNTQPWSYIDVETCNGSLEQKWNADPNLLNSALRNTREK